MGRGHRRASRHSAWSRSVAWSLSVPIPTTRHSDAAAWSPPRRSRRCPWWCSSSPTANWQVRSRTSERSAAANFAQPSQHVRLGWRHGHFLERPDGGVAGHLDFVRSAVADMIGPGDLVVCPLIDDGHPDHEAASGHGHRGTYDRSETADVPGLGVALSRPEIVADRSRTPTRTRRIRPTTQAHGHRAIRVPTGGDNPVVPAWMLPRLDRAFEVYVEPDAPAP